MNLLRVLCLSLCFASSVTAQTNVTIQQDDVWTKEDRTLILQEFESQLTRYTLLFETKQNVALCGMKETTLKYKKSEYNSMVDAELKQIYTSIIDGCARNMGVSLQSEEVKEGVDLLDGEWHSDIGSFTFDVSSRTYRFKAVDQVKTASGNFNVADGVIMLEGIYGFLGMKKKSNVYLKILSTTSTQMKVERQYGGRFRAIGQDLYRRNDKNVYTFRKVTKVKW